MEVSRFSILGVRAVLKWIEILLNMEVGTAATATE